MKLMHVGQMQCTLLEEAKGSPSQALTGTGFYWLDTTQEALRADPVQWRTTVQALTGISILDLHLQDAANPHHPSYFDLSAHYDMLIFRRLALEEENCSTTDQVATKTPKPQGKIPSLLHLNTQPVVFFMSEKILITVRSGNSKTFTEQQERLLHTDTQSIGQTLRLPATPLELSLRIVNALVDRYLDLRQPLTRQLDRWQRELLDPNHPFHNWLSLLDARVQLHRLENLCEEQYDALQELRDATLDRSESLQAPPDGLLVRINDVREHIGRVLTHTRRLQTAIESAVQLHFSATAHRTNDVIRTLTVITAIFMPLTLITGIFGMNFQHMPFLQDPEGFLLTLVIMGGLAIVMWLYFSARRYIESRPYRLAEKLARIAIQRDKKV